MDNKQSDSIIYTTDDGLTKIETTFDGDTVWLSKAQMAELFQRDRSVISKHIKNIFEEGELLKEGNVQILHVANSDKPVEFYNLDVIISVGYRAKSKRGTQSQRKGASCHGSARIRLFGFCGTSGRARTDYDHARLGEASGSHTDHEW